MWMCIFMHYCYSRLALYFRESLLQMKAAEQFLWILHSHIPFSSFHKQRTPWNKDHKSMTTPQLLADIQRKKGPLIYPLKSGQKSEEAESKCLSFWISSLKHPLCVTLKHSGESTVNVQAVQSLVRKGSYVNIMMGGTVWYSQYFNVLTHKQQQSLVGQPNTCQCSSSDNREHLSLMRCQRVQSRKQERQAEREFFLRPI